MVLSSLAWRLVWCSRFSTVSRSARASSISTTRRCTSGSEGPVMSSLTNARSTNTIASTSRMLARNLLPRPSPLLAPSTSPPMSTTSTAACTVCFDFDIADSWSSRSSGTLATPMFGSFVANGYGAASAPPPVSALYSEPLPALGRPTSPKRSMSRPRLPSAPRRPPVPSSRWRGCRFPELSAPRSRRGAGRSAERSRCVGGGAARPPLGRGPGTARHRVRRGRDGAIREPDHDPTGSDEIGVALAVALEAAPIEAVVGPSVALEDHRAVDDPEVDLVAVDDRMELDPGQPESLDQPDHRRLQDRIGGLRIDCPGVDGVAQHGSAGSSLAGVFERRDLQGAQVGESHGDHVSDGVAHAVGIDGAEVGERAQDVGATDAVATLRSEASPIGRAVHDDAVQVRLGAGPVDDHVDGFDLGSGDAPQACGRAM